MLRAMTKENGQWVETSLPANQSDFSAMIKFLDKRDGTDTVVIDDDKKRYYCGTNELVEIYEGKGLEADTFSPLAHDIFNRECQQAAAS